MLPLSLDLTRLRLVLVGDGLAAARRLAWLDEAGATAVTVFSDAPAPMLVRASGSRLQRRLPTPAELADAHLVFIAADLPGPPRDALAAAARAAGAILHVEDAPALSDVHAPAVLRRGALAIAISTDGAAPGLAAELKQFLGTIFGPEWRGRLDDMAALRRHWRQDGAGPGAIRRLTAAHAARYGWLDARCATAANDGDLAHNQSGGRS